MGKKGAEALKPFQFQPGQSGNPSGGARRKHVTDLYKIILQTPIDENLRKRLIRGRKALPLGKGATYGEALALRQILKAIITGDTMACKEVTNRVEGSAPRNLHINGQIEHSAVPLQEIRARLVNLFSGENVLQDAPALPAAKEPDAAEV